MTNEKDKTDQGSAGRWRIDPEALRQQLLDNLAARGVDGARLMWLSNEETDQLIQRWVDLGACRYGVFALIPPDDSDVRRAEYEDDHVPSWLDGTPHREVLISFSRPADGRRRIARCDFAFVLDNIASLALADGDGFAAVTPDLGGVLLVNVEEDLERSRLEIDAWGEFVRRSDL